MPIEKALTLERAENGGTASQFVKLKFPNSGARRSRTSLFSTDPRNRVVLGKLGDFVADFFA